MTITKQDVSAIVASGSAPTLNEVSKTLGDGNFSEISNGMREWRTAQEMAAAAL